MEIKKSPEADLQNRKGLFFEIGLVIALAAVLGAFLYTPKEYRIEQVVSNVVVEDQQIVEVTRQEQKPPEQPKKVEMQVVTDILDVVTNDTKITSDINFDEFTEDMEITAAPVEVEEEVIEEETPFIRVEKMPSFQGGDLNAFRNWVQGKLHYPQIAQENGISGRVVLSFVIEKDGTLTTIEVLQAPDRSLSEEAVRVLETSPKWEPGMQSNKAVRVKYTLPVDFQIRN